MNTTKTKADELVDKVYKRLDTVNLYGLSLKELEDFLGVVQRLQFLESIAKFPSTTICQGLPE